MVKKFGKLKNMDQFFKILENMKPGDEAIIDGIENVEIEIVDDSGKVVEIISKKEMERLNKLAEKAIKEDRGVIVEAKRVRFVKIPKDAVLVRGHYRRVNGKRVYVRPHYRNKPTRKKK